MSATSSPETVRNCSPAASSVVSIPGIAVENHALSERPETFFKPSTATEGRDFIFDGTVAPTSGDVLSDNAARNLLKFKPLYKPKTKMISNPAARKPQRYQSIGGEAISLAESAFT